MTVIQLKHEDHTSDLKINYVLFTEDFENGKKRNNTSCKNLPKETDRAVLIYNGIKSYQGLLGINLKFCNISTGKAKTL